MSSTPSSTISGSRRSASSRVQPVLASTRIGPPKTSRTARSVSRSCGPPSLILSAGNAAARDARSATISGSSMPIVKSVGGIVGREADQLVDRDAQHLAHEVVQGDVDGAFGGPVPADRPVHAGHLLDQADRRARRLADRREERRHDRHHRVGGLAVEPVRVPLPEPDDARVALVAQLDDDRRHALPGVVVGAGDAERVAQREVQDLVAKGQTHGSASTASRTDAHSRSPPKRTGSSAGSPVRAATSSISRRASASSG